MSNAIHALRMWNATRQEKVLYGNKRGQAMKTIKLTQGQETMVDDDDFEKLNKYKWHVLKGRRTFYAVRTSRESKIMMHRVICNVPKGMQVDHIDGNGLNNCKSNLRIVTSRQNNQNKHIKKSSIYPGVSWCTSRKKWRSDIEINGKQNFIGRFNVEVNAYNAYLEFLKGIKEVCIREM